MSAELGPIQTRDHSGELREWDTLGDAIAYARVTPGVWKISFDRGGERIRLVRDDAAEPFYLELMLEKLDALRLRLRDET